MPVTPTAGLLGSTSAREHQYIYDAETLLHDGAAAITASGAAQVDSAAQILDVGDGYVPVDVVCDVSALDFTTGDETYSIIVQGSSTADFSSDIVNLAELRFGAGAAGASDDSSTGRRVLSASNRNVDANTYRYIRVYFLVGGTSPSITAFIFATKRAA